jgi:DNA-binding GntR family transcriptional regulator
MQAPATATREPAIDARSLTLIAFDRVRADVIGGQLRPGERLRVQALSARYGIGATAIREALSRLVTDGLVQSEEQRGFLVSPVSRGDLIDLTETRVDLESLALRRAIERGDTAWEADVLARLHRLAKCPPPVSPEASVTWSGLHRSFHESLLAGCGSPWLLSLCSFLYDKSERYRCLASIRASARSSRRGDEHGALADALLSRDGDAACRLLAAHYRETTEIILQAKESAGLFDAAEPARGRSRSRL